MKRSPISAVAVVVVLISAFLITLVLQGANAQSSNSNEKSQSSNETANPDNNSLANNGSIGSDVPDDSGNTPLHIAARKGDEESATALLQNGSDVDAVNNFSSTALHLAVEQGHENIVQLLLKYNPNVWITDKQGRTPSRLAKIGGNGHEGIATLLQSYLRVNPAKKACDLYKKVADEPSGDMILNGEMAKAGEFPWMTALGYRSKYLRSKIIFLCAGTIISKRFVLTAAHCVEPDDLPVIVRMGKIYVRDYDRIKSDDHHVDSIIRHPNFSYRKLKNDIALIKVAEQIWFSALIRPACLFTSMDDLDPSRKLAISGWGVISVETEESSDDLLKANLSTVALDECNELLSEYSYRPVLEDGVDESQYCATDVVGGSDTCQGDSGGPLQLRSNDGKMAEVVGIVSFGIGCGPRSPGVYTRVAYYLKWIEGHVWPNGVD